MPSRKIDVPFAKDLQEAHSKIGEALTFCVGHYVNVCDTVLFAWRAAIARELEACELELTMREESFGVPIDILECSRCGKSCERVWGEDYEFCPYCGRRVEMPTNDERREVAERLRKLPIDMYEVEERWEAEGLGTDCHDQTDYSLIHNVLFGCIPAEHMHPYDYDELHCRLADLIEPEPERTCRSVGGADGTNGEYYDFMCSECGYCCDLSDPDYCPNCGAKVVEG